MFRHWRDLTPGLVILAVIAALFAVTTTFATVPAAFAQGMQATAMPRLVLGTIALLTILMVLQGRGTAEPDRAPVPWPVWATVAVLALAAALFQMLGTTLVVFLVGLILPTLWGERRFGVVALYALSLPAAIYGVFSIILQLRLPQGILDGVL